MKFKIIADHRHSFTEEGMKSLSKLGFKLKYDKQYKVWWLNLDDQTDVFIDFKKIKDLVVFLRENGHREINVDEDIPTIEL